ncbi:MAG: insulinase family protein [Deltaproteobacteria bacterium]|nr:insulinase family protein [Deltaproteobacteria bacterium]
MRVRKQTMGWTAGCMLCILIFGISQASGIPAVKKVHWKNGLTFIASEQRHLPMVYLRLLIKGGSSADPRGKEGLANLTSSLLSSGTRTHTAAEISEALDFLGASLRSECTEDFSSFSLKVLTKDLNRGISLLSEILLNPAFPEEEVVKKKTEIQAAILAKNDDPGEVAQRAFLEALFGDTPYGHPPEGKETSLPGIGRQDIVTHYRKYYRPNNAILVAAGDFDLEEFQTLLKSKLAQWASAPVPQEDYRADFPESRKIILKDMSITQANIVLGMQGIKRSNPDYYPLSIMNYILGGGGFASRLMEEIRTRRGLAYSVNSVVDARAYPGSFQVVLQTKNESAGKAVELVLGEIQKIRRSPVSHKELEGAKRYLIGSFPLRLDSNTKLVSFLSLVEFYDLGLEYMERYPSIIRQVSAGEVLRAAGWYLDPDTYVLVVVADQKKADLKGLK